MYLKRKRESGEVIALSRPKYVSVCTSSCLPNMMQRQSRHKFTTLNMDTSMRVMATEMNDTDPSMKLTDSDLEAKYYLQNTATSTYH